MAESTRSGLNLIAVSVCLGAVAVVAWLLWPADSTPEDTRPARSAPTAETTAPSKPAQTEARVSGRVISAPDGLPVMDASVVFVSAAGEIPAVVSEDGTFSLVAPVGPGVLVAEAPALRSAGRNDDGVNIVVPDRGTLGNVTIELFPGAELVGQVQIHGRPADAQVTLHYQSDESGATDYDAEVLDTDPEGRFRFIGIAPGLARARVSGSGAAPLATEAFDVVPGETVDVGTLTLRPGGTVSGWVVDDGGNALAGARVGTRTVPPIETVTDDRGAFALYGVPTGTVSVVATRTGFAEGWTEAVVAAEGEARATIELKPLAGVAVRVLDGTAPGVGAVVSLVDTTSDATPLVKRVDDSGFVHFSEVTGGPFSVEAMLDGETVSQMVDAGSSITLAFAGDNVIRGVVLTSDGNAAREANLTLLSETPDGSRNGVGSTTTDANGRFEFSGLDAGRYVIGARAAGHRYTESDPVPVDGGEATLTLRLGVGGTLVGTVVDEASGVAIGNARISLGGSRHSIRTDERGGYRYEGLPENRVTVEFSADGYRARMMSGIEVTDGETRRVDVSLQPAAEGDEEPGFEMVGIGITISRNDDGSVVVNQPMDGGAAAGAGLLAGDRILAVDGTNAEELGFREIVESIRGEVGTSVRLRIARDGAPPFELEIDREPVVVDR